MPPSRRGFTLIELLIVVVILGILAAVAIPKFQNTKGKANAASLRSDLRNLVTAQEGYFFEHSEYTSNVASLNAKLTTGVTVTIGEATTGGWSAVVTHPQAWPLRCAVFFGNAAVLSPALAEGVMHCE